MKQKLYSVHVGLIAFLFLVPLFTSKAQWICSPNPTLDVIDKGHYVVITGTPSGTPHYETFYYATIDWASGDENKISGYEVRYRKRGTSTWTTKTSNVSSYKMLKLPANTVYEFQARYAGTCYLFPASLGWSDILTFSTSSSNCFLQIPTGFEIEHYWLGSMTVFLTWNKVVGATYEVQYKKLSAPAADYQTKSTRELTLLLTPLEPNTEYIVRIRSKCSTTNEYSAWSAGLVFTTDNCNLEPIRGSAYNDTKVYIDWDNGASWPDDGKMDAIAFAPAIYTLEYNLVSNPSLVTRKSVKLPPLWVENLTPNREYEFRLRKNCGTEQTVWRKVRVRTEATNARVETLTDGSIQAENTITITDETSEVFVKVMDQYGKEVISKKEQVNENKYDASNAVTDLPKGLYLIEVRSNTQRVVNKVMKVD